MEKEKDTLPFNTELTSECIQQLLTFIALKLDLIEETRMKRLIDSFFPCYLYAEHNTNPVYILID